MEFFKSWFEILRDFHSGKFWWSLALLACFADCYLILFFNVGLVAWIRALPAFSEVSFTGSVALAIACFTTLAALAWFYLLPLVIVPLWQKAMFELNWRLSTDYRHSPMEKAGWRWLPSIQREAAIAGNALLLEYCKERDRVVAERKHQLTCLLGIAFFGVLALCADATGARSLPALMLNAWSGFSSGLQFLLLLLAMPGIMVVGIIVGDEDAKFSRYIYLPEYGENE